MVGPEANHAAVLGFKPLLKLHEMTNGLELEPFGNFQPSAFKHSSCRSTSRESGSQTASQTTTRPSAALTGSGTLRYIYIQVYTYRYIFTSIYVYDGLRTQTVNPDGLAPPYPPGMRVPPTSLPPRQLLFHFPSGQLPEGSETLDERALPNEIKVGSGTSQSKSGVSVDLRRTIFHQITSHVDISLTSLTYLVLC